MTFDDCLQFVYQVEGIQSDDPQDPGGLTRFGIAQNSHPGIDVGNLTKSQAADIYRDDYWTPTHCDALEAPIALCVFDTAVNMGCKRSIELLQQAISANVDGEFGPQTLELVNAMPVQALVEAFHTVREAAYRGTAHFNRFGQGWLHRNDACRDLALSWVHKPDA